MLSPRACFRISIVGAVIVLALFLYGRSMPAVAVCGELKAGYDPIVALELVRSVADVQAILGSADNACRAAISERLSLSILIDSAIYIPAYLAFLAFGLLGLREHGGRLGWAGCWIAVFAAGMDYVENLSMWQILGAPDQEAPWMLALFASTFLKWIGLGVATLIGGCLLWTSGIAGKIAIVPTSLALLASLWALIAPESAGPLLTTAMAAGWMTLLIAVVWGAFQRPRTVERA